MKWYYATLGIYTKSGCITGTETEEFEASSDEEAVEIAKDLESKYEEIYACVMVDELVDENGNEIKIN